MAVTTMQTGARANVANYIGARTAAQDRLNQQKNYVSQSMLGMANQDQRRADMLEEQTYARRQTAIANLVNAMKGTGQVISQEHAAHEARQAAGNRDWLGRTGTGGGFAGLPELAMAGAGAGGGALMAAGAGGLTSAQGAMLGMGMAGSMGGAVTGTNPQGYAQASQMYMGAMDWQSANNANIDDWFGGSGGLTEYTPSWNQ